MQGKGCRTLGRRLLVSVAAGSSLVGAADARAEWRPDFRTHLEFEFWAAKTFRADGPDGTRAVFIETETAEFDFRPVPQFGGVLNVGFEPAGEPLERADDTLFKRQALFPQELYLHYETVTLFPDVIDRARVFGGKFQPNFGIQFGFDQEETEFSGPVTEDFMEEYELVERIGLGGEITPYHRKYGYHTLSVSGFFDDTTPLSGDAFHARDRRRLSSGGPSNTESLESVNVTVKGSDMSFLRGVNYELGFRHQARGESPADVKDENGFAVGAQYKKAFFLPRDRFRYPLKLLGSVEYARFSGFNARDVNVDYVTASLGLDYGPWNFAVGYGRKDQSVLLEEDEEEEEEGDGEDEGGPRRDVVDDRWQVSLARRFSPFLIGHLFWAYEEEGGEGTQLAGIVLEYEKMF